MEIRIDPAGEPRRVLLALAAMLTALAGGDGAIAAEDRPDVGANLSATSVRPPPETIGQVIGFKRFVAEGTPNPAIIDPAQAFGAGNVGAASGSVSSPTPVPTGAASSATIPPIPGVPPVPTGADNQVVELDPAAAFGGGAGGPNVAPSAGVPPVVLVPPAIVPPPGMPAVPNNGAATAGASTVELDADGLPWDSRIHSSAKNKNAGDKKWKAKRGVMPQLVASVTAELRAALSAGGNVQAPAAAPPVPAATLTPPPPGLTTNVTAAPSNVGVPTFQMLLPRVTSAMAAGTLTQETAGQLCAYISEGKVTSVAMLAVAPQLVPAMWAQLDAMGVA